MSIHDKQVIRFRFYSQFITEEYRYYEDPLEAPPTYLKTYPET